VSIDSQYSASSGDSSPPKNISSNSAPITSTGWPASTASRAFLVRQPRLDRSLRFLAFFRLVRQPRFAASLRFRESEEGFDLRVFEPDLRDELFAFFFAKKIRDPAIFEASYSRPPISTPFSSTITSNPPMRHIRRWLMQSCIRRYVSHPRTITGWPAIPHGFCFRPRFTFDSGFE
jgi:hypothetical protein